MEGRELRKIFKSEFRTDGIRGEIEVFDPEKSCGKGNFR